VIKKIFILTLGFLLMGVNVFAAGDLIVNGKLGVGTGSPTNPLHIVYADQPALLTLDGTITQGGIKKGLNVVFDFEGTTANPNTYGAFYLVRSQGQNTTGGSINGFMGNANYESSGIINEVRGAANIVNINTTAAGTTYEISNAIGNSVELRKGSTNQQAVSLTNYYGFYSFGNSGPGLGSISATNARHAYFEDFPNFSGTIDNTTGLWIERQTSGTSNYGLVLNGDETGADIVFGPTQQQRIYSRSGEIFVHDGTFETQISPHDPETGEWIFYSKNVKTGRVVRIDMERLVKTVEKLTGETFMVEEMQ
jgi:hypothetical protein